MRALVTGGGGFLGRYIVEQLAARGDFVRVFCRGNYPQLEELGVELVQGDVRDQSSLMGACEGMDVVFHVAAVPGVWGRRETYFAINTQGTENVIAACRSQGVRKLVYTSSPSVVYDGRNHCGADESLPYPESYLAHYPASKAAAERAVLSAGGKELATCAVRPHLIWGPRDNHLLPRLIQKAKSGRLRRVGDGDNLISMAYVENVAHAHLMAVDALDSESPVNGQAYFINEREPVPLWEWIDQLLKLAGLTPVQRRISASSAYRLGGLKEGAFRWLRLPGEPPMTRFVASQLSGSHYYSVAKAERDFGFEPLVSVEEGLRRTEPDLIAWAHGSTVS